jgi:hypothetical protein
MVYVLSLKKADADFTNENSLSKDTIIFYQPLTLKHQIL